jgi:hypothetical protein
MPAVEILTCTAFVVMPLLKTSMFLFKEFTKAKKAFKRNENFF